MRVSWKHVSLFAFALLVAILIAGCDNAATTTASCAFVTGNGQNGNDAKLHRIVYPGQSVQVDSNENESFVPCNSRNYIINNGTVTNANGQKVGDRGQLIVATTSTSVTINIAVRALWTLNQSDTAMRAFYNVCFKYQCASPEDQSGDANFSTEGWNGMLAENFGPAMDTSARMAAITVDDSIWKQHDPAQYQALGDKMSAVFADVIRANLGYREDLFCGSGNSAWSDPDSPGEGTFNCTPVRIVVDDVQLVPDQSDQSSEGAVAINQQRKASAEVLYDQYAGYWLGLQDSIDKCKDAGITCIFNIGDAGGGLGIPIPTASPVPEPTPSPTEEP